MLHEFGHALGLGHAYFNDGDLMCGTQGYNGVTIKTSKQYSVQGARPSALDIKALFYIYGNDGFNEPNNGMLDAGIKQYNNTKIVHAAYTPTMVRLEFQQTMAKIVGPVLMLSTDGTSGSSGG